MSRNRKGRDIHGLLLLNKSAGISSNGALQRVKRLFEAKKAGHTGSLDPIAEGVLPICFGEATKLSGFLLDSDKRYFTRVRLGQSTTTCDVEGEVIETKPVPNLDGPMLEVVLRGFRGQIEQLPPMYSALKHQGRKLYELARQGVEVERKPRTVTIHELRLLDFGENFIDLDVHCSKGTYIRTLADDLGRKLGCGGHVEQLKRTGVGRFSIEQAVKFEDLELMPEDDRFNFLRSFDAIAEELPVFTLSLALASAIRLGRTIAAPNTPSSGLLRLFTDEGAFIGVGEVNAEGLIAPRRLTQQPIHLGIKPQSL